MKVHNYGNDYAQSMKFQNQEKENVANPTQPEGSKAGGEAAEIPEEKKAESVEEPTEGGEKEQQNKREKAGKGAGKKSEKL